jgi:hypothetical protein
MNGDNPSRLVRVVRFGVIAAGVALFVQSVRATGIPPILDGLGRVGWGFAAILLLSGAREVVRTLAWTRSVEGGATLRFPAAFRARLAGEALNALLPLGMVVGEPTKASQVTADIPFATAFTALVIEFAFYTASLFLLLGSGFAAFAMLSHVPLGRYATAVAAAAGIAALGVLASIRWSRRLRDTIFGFASRHPQRARAIVGCEVAYHLLSVTEVYLTLLLISPVHPTIGAAIVLETVNRVVTMVFKILPMRIGVDEVGASVFAARMDLASATGLSLALIRKLRLLVWSAVGLALLVRRRDAAVGFPASRLWMSWRPRSYI